MLNPKLITTVKSEAPGTRGMQWPRSEGITTRLDASIDKFYDVDALTKTSIATGVMTSARK